jgi:hypothetical protein
MMCILDFVVECRVLENGIGIGKLVLEEVLESG